MIQLSKRFLPTLLATSMSCILLTACGVDDKPELPHKTDSGKTDGGKTDGGKTDGGKEDTKENHDISFLINNQSRSKSEFIDGNVTLYDNSTNTTCDDFDAETCGAINFTVTLKEFEIFPLLTKEKPATVKYTLSSSQGNIADILKNPSQATGTVDLYGIARPEGIFNPTNQLVNIPLKEDALKDGNIIVTITLSEPTNPVGKAAIGNLNTIKYTIVDVGGGTPKVMAKVNDTGITYTGDKLKGNQTDCDNAMTSKQDCNVGRDAMYNDNSNGWAGFDFTKVSSTGEDLPVTATDWSCVRDNVTGLVWERKTYAPQIEGKYGAEGNANKDYRDVKWNYIYYDKATGLGVDEGDTDCKLGDNVKCNTQNYTDAVNKNKLCGISNWRLPNRNELYGIQNLNGLNEGEIMQSDWFFSNDKEFPIYFWTNSIAAFSKYGAPYQFDAVWLLSAKAEFGSDQPKGSWSNPSHGVILVSGTQQ